MHWNGIGEPRPAGPENLTRLFSDERFWAALVGTFFSPLLLLRILLLVAAPLSLALLFMELRSGLRLTFQAVLAPLVFFSGAAVTAFLYFTYYAPMGGLAVKLAGEAMQPPLADPNAASGALHNLLLANGLGWSVPLGIALFLASARGARLTLPAGRDIYREFWSRAGRFIIILSLMMIGFSWTGLEGAFAFRVLPGRGGDNLITLSFDYGLRFMQLGVGATAILFLILPLLVLGLGVMLVMEVPRARFSIRLAARTREKPAAGAAWGAGRIVAAVLAGVMALAVIVTLVIVVLLPWLGSVTGLGGRGADGMERLAPELLGSLVRSYGVALPAAILCLIYTAAAGFALGYLRPRGGKAVLIAVGSFMFMTPALYLLPYYMTFRSLGLIDTLFGLVLPGIISPLGMIVFTLLFRGLRDEYDALSAGGRPVNGFAFAGRVASGMALFSIPMLTAYLLAGLNGLLLPFTMSLRPETQTLPLELMRLRGEYTFGGPGLQAGAGLVALLQYLLPCALLVVGIIIVFPRLALVMRKKGEGIPAPEPEVIDRMKK
jgi:ABC-type glycerol-3-phosphate transport system permease component